MTLDIAVRTPDGRPAKGDFSIAVTDRSAIPLRTAGDIYSTLVLSSELRGVIEEPDYYFNAQHADAAQALDELLLTQGWRRYDVSKLLRGEYEEPRDPLVAGQEIAGRVVPGNDARFQKRIDSYSVQLLIPRSGFATQTRIRPDGTFSLSGFDFPDSTTFVLRAARKGSEVDNLPIEVTPDSFPTFSRLPKPRIFDPRYADRALEYIDWRGSADIRNVLIDPIDVIHHIKEPDPVEQRMATRSYSAQQIKESGAVTLLDILQRIPGMYLVGQRVWYRGKQPAFMIDGIVEYTPKMLMNYGLTAGRVRDKSVDEMKEELRQKDNPQVNVNNLKNHTFTPLGEGKGFGHDIQYTEDYDALPTCLSTPLVQIKRVSIIEGANASFWGNNLKDSIIAITLKKGKELEEAYAGMESESVRLITPLGYQTPAEFYPPRLRNRTEPPVRRSRLPNDALLGSCRAARQRRPGAGGILLLRRNGRLRSYRRGRDRRRGDHPSGRVYSEQYITRLFLLQQIFQFVVVAYAFDLSSNNLLDIGFDTDIIRLDDLIHTIRAVLIDERRKFGDRDIGGRFSRYTPGIEVDAGMEYLLLDRLVDIVGHSSDEHTLREVGDLGCRDQIVKLRIGRGRHVVVRAGYRFPLLDDLPETLRQRAGRVAHDLPDEEITHGILNDLSLLLSVVAFQLREILKAQTYGDLVRSGCRDKIVQPSDIYRRQLVDDDRRLETVFLVYQTDDAGVV